MKKLITCATLLTMFGMSAHATLECKGQGKNSKVAMSVLDLSSRKVVEGQKNPVAVRIVEAIKNAKGYNDEVILFAGVVEGTTEDVHWFLESNDKKSLSGHIYIDELYDMSISVGNRKIRFNCEQ